MLDMWKRQWATTGLVILLMTGCKTEPSMSSAVAADPASKKEVQANQGSGAAHVTGEHYRLWISVPSGCYQFGEIDELKRDNSRYIRVEVEFKGGICTQALKRLERDVYLSDPLGVNEPLIVEYINLRSNESTLITLPAGG